MTRANWSSGVLKSQFAKTSRTENHVGNSFNSLDALGKSPLRISVERVQSRNHILSTRFRYQWVTPCRFESGHSHKHLADRASAWKPLREERFPRYSERTESWQATVQHAPGAPSTSRGRLLAIDVRASGRDAGARVAERRSNELGRGAGAVRDRRVGAAQSVRPDLRHSCQLADPPDLLASPVLGAGVQQLVVRMATEKLGNVKFHISRRGATRDWSH
jgi:hypothetical protein